MASPVIEFRDFSFKYRVQAEPTLLNINLKINEGEKILICGPSGCGKSTLASTLNGLIPASYKGDITGDLIIDGKSWKDWDLFSLSKVTGTVLQDSDGQFIGLTVGEDIAFALENDCVPLEKMKKEVRDAAEGRNGGLSLALPAVTLRGTEAESVASRRHGRQSEDLPLRRAPGEPRPRKR